MDEKMKHARAVAKTCVREAQQTMGKGWGEIGPRTRRGLVDSRILGVILSQSSQVPAEAILRYLRDLSQAADDLLGQEGE